MTLGLGLLDGQPANIHVAVEVETDRAVRANQAFAGNGAAREGFQNLDNQQVRRLDAHRVVDHPAFTRGRVVWESGGNGSGLISSGFGRMASSCLRIASRSKRS